MEATHTMSVQIPFGTICVHIISATCRTDSVQICDIWIVYHHWRDVFFTLSSVSILDTPKIRVVEYRIDWYDENFIVPRFPLTTHPLIIFFHVLKLWCAKKTRTTRVQRGKSLASSRHNQRGGIVHIMECVDIHALQLSTKNLFYAYPHQLLCGYHNSLSREVTHMTRMND